MITEHQLFGWAGAWGEQGGHQAMQFTIPWSVGIVQRLFDDAQKPRLSLLLARVILRIQVGQIGAIGEVPQIARNDEALQSTQQHARPSHASAGSDTRRESRDPAAPASRAAPRASLA